jgi:hypothetical protein
MPKLDHTPHTKKQILEPIFAFHATNIMVGTICKFVKPQNGPTFHEHVIQGFHLLQVKHYLHSSITPHPYEGVTFP